MLRDNDKLFNESSRKLVNVMNIVIEYGCEYNLVIRRLKSWTFHFINHLSRFQMITVKRISEMTHEFVYQV